jgi:dTMP kinase
MSGFFLTFEGGEGSGKSTQARLLAEALQSAGRTVCLTREPGGCPSAEAVRALVFTSGMHFTPTAELLLMCAARAEHVAHTIRPALARGEIVICDRFSDSTRVYQGAASGVDPAAIAAVNAVATGGLVPDLTLFLDIPPEEGLRRIQAAARATNAFDARPLDFHRKIRAGFQDLAAREPQRIRVVDAQRPVTDVTGDVLGIVQGLLTA